MIELQDLREMFNEVREILIEGYRQRGKEEYAIFIEQFETDALIGLVLPLIDAGLQKIVNDVAEVASL